MSHTSSSPLNPRTTDRLGRPLTPRTTTSYAAGSHDHGEDDHADYPYRAVEHGVVPGDLRCAICDRVHDRAVRCEDVRAA